MKEMNERTRVIEFISTIGDGGAEILVKDYASLIDRNKFEVKILTVYKPGLSACYQQLLENHVPVQSILKGGNDELHLLIKHTVGFVKIPNDLYKIIQQFQPSSIHVHMNQLHHLVPLIRRLEGINVLYTCHNNPKEYFSGISGGLEKRAVQRFTKYDRFTLIALHNDMAKQLKEMFDYNNVVVIKNGINFERFTNIPATKEEIRRGLGIPESSFVIGHVGRFQEQKNHAFIIDVFAELKKRHKEAYLLLIGSGPLETEIKRKIGTLRLGDSCLILSHRSDIPELMKAMDTFFFPSLYEGMPVTLIEAQVSKLPCIVSDRVNSSAVLLPSTKVYSLETPITEWVDALECAKHDNVVELSDELKEYNLLYELRKIEELYKN